MYVPILNTFLIYLNKVITNENDIPIQFILNYTPVEYTEKIKYLIHPWLYRNINDRSGKIDVSNSPTCIPDGSVSNTIRGPDEMGSNTFKTLVEITSKVVGTKIDLGKNSKEYIVRI